MEVGEVTNLGDFGRKYTLVTHNPVGDRATYKFKGSYDDGALQLQMARVPDDAGQEVIVTALDSDDKYNFKVELDDNPGGTGSAPTTFKFKGLVMSYTANVGSVNNIVQSMVELQISGVDRRDAGRSRLRVKRKRPGGAARKRGPAAPSPMRKHEFWRPQPLWPGATAFVLGGGPSLRDVDLTRLKGGAAKVCAVNEASKHAPWADLLYFSDKSWYQKNCGFVRDTFNGLRVTVSRAAKIETDALHRIEVDLKLPGLHGDGQGPAGPATAGRRRSRSPPRSAPPGSSSLASTCGSTPGARISTTPTTNPSARTSTATSSCPPSTAGPPRRSARASSSSTRPRAAR